MYAIVDIAGKQFKVTKDQFVYAPSLAGEEGASVEFGNVLLFGNDDGVEIGSPLLSGVTVAGKILEHGRGDKVIIFKKKRRKGYKKIQGHRQNYTKILIEDILTGGKKTSARKTEPAKQEEAPKKAEPVKKEAVATKAEKQEETKAAYAMEDVLKSVGTAKKSDKDDLKELKGIGEVFEKALNDHGIYTFEQISKLTPEDMEALSEIDGVTRHLIEEEDWVGQTKEKLEEQKAARAMDDVLKNVGTAKQGDKDDLKEIKGIGEVFEKALNDHGIYTYEQISKLKAKDKEALEANIDGVTRHLIEEEDWVGQAKKLMKEEK